MTVLVNAYVIFVCCSMVFSFIWYWITKQRWEEEESRGIGKDVESATARAERILSHQTLPSFSPKTQIARVAVRALPPVTPFQEDQTPHSQTQCPICIQHFRNGELTQPFGLCSHHFHPSCINSWLFRGNTNCPVCRMELRITIHP